MNPSHPNNYINLILNSKIYIRNVTDNKREILESLGGIIDENENIWVIAFEGEKHLAKILSVLAESELLFVGGVSGWPPAEIFADLRDKNLVVGNFQEVTWLRKGEWIVKDR